MKVEIDTHCHTIMSGHAYNTLREMAKMAADKGLKGLAITDHAPEMPGGTHLFYFNNLRVVPRELYGIKLLLGAELNIMNAEGKVDLPNKVIQKLDITIASMHTPCYKGEMTKEEVTGAYIKVMERGDIDIIGHPDDGRYAVDYLALVQAAKEHHVLLELNNSSLNPNGFRPDTRENDETMLRYCMQYDVPIILGSDAHVEEDVAEFSRARLLLEEICFPEELVVNDSLEKLLPYLPYAKLDD